jgi:hypothetical protein
MSSIQVSVSFSDKKEIVSIAGLHDLTIWAPFNKLTDCLPNDSMRLTVIFLKVSMQASVPIISFLSTFSRIEYLKASRELMPKSET